MFGNTHIDGKTMKNKTVTSQVRVVFISRDFWAVGNTLFLGLNGDYMETHFLFSNVYIYSLRSHLYVHHSLFKKLKQTGAFISRWKLEHILGRMHDREQVIILVTQYTPENGY